MVAGEQTHQCLGAVEVYRLSRDQAYLRAEGCPLCVELVDFVARTQRLQALTRLPHTDASQLVEETKLNRLLDHFNLFERNRVMKSFDEVVSKTLTTLQRGQRVRLFSMGELLEARHPFAFHELINAVKRGVNLEYFLNESEASVDGKDYDILRVNLHKAVGEQTAERALSVEYVSISMAGRKDVYYFDDSGDLKDRLVEVSYRTTGQYPGARRMWIRVDEREREDFVSRLQEQ